MDMIAELDEEPTEREVNNLAERIAEGDQDEAIRLISQMFPDSFIPATVKYVVALRKRAA